MVILNLKECGFVFQFWEKLGKVGKIWESHFYFRLFLTRLVKFMFNLNG